MYSSLPQIATISLDALLSVAACLIFLRPSLRTKYPWIFRYLCARAITGVIIEFLLYGPLLASPDAYTKIYFVTWWASFALSTTFLFLGCSDVYRQAMAPLPGLARVGSPVFRWAALVSLLITATTLSSIPVGPRMVMEALREFARCMGTSELCLVALLLFSVQAIRLSPRSRPFGIAVGLGIMAATDCAQSILMGTNWYNDTTVQIILQAVSFPVLALWIAYALVPEPAGKPVTLPVNSTIYKWNQIASALGHKGTQVVLEPAPSFFLVDVEKVVERAFVRTLKNKESES